MLVMVTNTDNTDLEMPYLPWSDGTEVCNIFWPNDDCQTVSGGKI
jgi:hypothetical protein